LGVHQRLAEPLQMQLAHAVELIDQPREAIEGHEGQRAVGWAVAAELDRAHLAAQVALPDGLDLHVGRQRYRRHGLPPGDESTRLGSKPRASSAGPTGTPLA
jgi:hypothetical protein